MPGMDAILGELSAPEPIFHRWEWGVSRDELLAMTDDAFWEIGASGQAYSREFVVETLLERYTTTGPAGILPFAALGRTSIS